jgi:hypothetical protein
LTQYRSAARSPARSSDWKPTSTTK